MTKKVAVIDLGSNSARMVIFGRTSRLGFYILGEYKMKVRLGEGAYEHSGIIQEDAMKKCFGAFVEFRKILNRYKIQKILAVGTSALRDAKNANEFINMVKKLGISLKVVDGDMEAYYGGFGAARLVKYPDNATTIDIGGGSTELAKIQSGKVVKTLSLNLGTVRLKELFYDKENLNGLDKFVKELTDKIPKDFQNNTIISIGGSLRAISNAIIQRKNYPLKMVHGFSYNYEREKSFIEKIYSSKISDLGSFFIKKDRFDTIRGGAYIFKKVADILKAKEIITSGVGVREGVFLTNLIGKNAKFPGNFNPSLKSLQDRFITQNRPNITKFSKELFYTLKPLHKVSENYINELLTASKLTDIGRKIGFYSKHLNANFIILNALNYGYTHKEKALIATIIKQNGKKNISQIEYEELKELLPDENSVIWLSFILKLATVLDYSNIKNVSLSYKNKTLEIYGLKEDEYIKDTIKKMQKPGIFAITFN
ncbi:Ppx/GppA phosphatase family protein [Campylobacter ureolyticus]|uniref:Ppx/GppA phosphatase family protein n=1 Tax=Campylobacter ureolyticus TaxID=827 RepID=UPI0022B42F16|nr:Ppx/GppA phosphatase family protein [Campylobacter ureolyticus]MCZ6174049.1 Ppx/GppA phosphatase family protein [Campylobacter ureolyticus]